MTSLRSSLAPYAASMNEPDPANAKKAARQAWQEHGILLVRPQWFQGYLDQKQVTILAERLFGKREG